MKKVLPVFYSPRMVAKTDSASPSAAKPGQVVADWKRLNLPIAVVSPEPVTEAQLSRAHDPEFVRGIMSLKVANGFGTKSAVVAASLPYTSGAMLQAARHAINHKTIACAPCSGFHHAGYDREAGFCTFNGLVVTAMALQDAGDATRIGILDLDMHYGDGTEELIKKHGLKGITHYTAGRDFRRASQAKNFFKWLPTILAAMAKCDVVLYQAGADPHIDDPLGGFLTTEQLRERDDMVFSLLSRPVAWNLAGGYQVEKDGSIPKVLEIHANTARAAIRAL